jgi:hypothetical protein
MTRYVATNDRPRANWFSDDNPLLRDLTVDEHEAVKTGLVTPAGKPIMRLPNPIGFGRDSDW